MVMAGRETSKERSDFAFDVGDIEEKRAPGSCLGLTDLSLVYD